MSNPLVINKHTFDILLKRDKPGDLIALYLFYCYETKEQRTNQIRCAAEYTTEKLGWTTPRLSARKKVLEDLGLIKDIVVRENGRISGRYVEVAA